MKKFSIIILAILSISIVYYFFTKKESRQQNTKNSEVFSVDSSNETIFHSGDIIFQTSLSDQSKAIQKATNSKYSHCGIIVEEKGKMFVLEAIQPVTITSLDEWIKRGKNSHYVVKRLKNSSKILQPDVLEQMKSVGKEFIGRDYDLTFEWSDDKIYCSELVWKIYQRTTGLELGNLQKLREFNLENNEVKGKLKERYGDQVPLNEIVISPESIFQSELLETVELNQL